MEESFMDKSTPVIGIIKAEEVNPVLLSLMRSGLAGVFGRVEPEDEEPVADTMEIAIMDVIQARRTGSPTTRRSRSCVRRF
jgi:hypothetical protein